MLSETMVGEIYGVHSKESEGGDSYIFNHTFIEKNNGKAPYLCQQLV